MRLQRTVSPNTTPKPYDVFIYWVLFFVALALLTLSA